MRYNHHMRYFIRFKLIAVMLVLFLYGGQLAAKSIMSHQSKDVTFNLVTVVEGLDYPWAVAFLPNGDYLITEKTGALRRVHQGVLDPNPISGLPNNLYGGGQGGLLDIILHPEFEQNQFIYLTYSGRGSEGAGTELLRARLVGNHLHDVKILFKAIPKTHGRAHYGSRLVFDRDGYLYMTIGDRYRYLKEAQNPENSLGTVVRLNADGTLPNDNPFINHASYEKAVYSYGHRNPQGIALRPSDQSLWLHEHGPRGGDEVNKLKSGANYGWPTITYGIDYSGLKISDKTHAPDMEQPIIYWDPSIAPSGMVFYDGDQFPIWRGDLFIGALAGSHLRRLILDGDRVVGEEILLKDFARIRDVRNGPDGYLYILTDDDNGQLLRLEPVS